MPINFSHSPSLADTQAYLIPARKLDYVWDDVRPLIEEASFASRDKWFAEDAYERLRKAKAQLWVVWQDGAIIAVAITELIPHERRQVCKVVTCAGWNIRKWLKHLAEVESWAKTQGCDHME